MKQPRIHPQLPANAHDETVVVQRAEIGGERAAGHAHLCARRKFLAPDPHFAGADYEVQKSTLARRAAAFPRTRTAPQACAAWPISWKVEKARQPAPPRCTHSSGTTSAGLLAAPLKHSNLWCRTRKSSCPQLSCGSIEMPRRLRTRSKRRVFCFWPPKEGRQLQYGRTSSSSGTRKRPCGGARARRGY